MERELRWPERRVFLEVLKLRRLQLHTAIQARVAELLDSGPMFGRDSQGRPGMASALAPSPWLAEPTSSAGATAMAKPPKPIPPPPETQFVDTVGDGVEMLNIGTLDVETSAIVVAPSVPSAIVMRDNVMIDSAGNEVRMPALGKAPAMVALEDLVALVNVLVERCAYGGAVGHADMVRLKRDVAALAGT